MPPLASEEGKETNTHTHILKHQAWTRAKGNEAWGVVLPFQCLLSYFPAAQSALPLSFCFGSPLYPHHWTTYDQADGFVTSVKYKFVPSPYTSWEKSTNNNFNNLSPHMFVLGNIHKQYILTTCPLPMLVLGKLQHHWTIKAFLKSDRSPI